MGAGRSDQPRPEVVFCLFCIGVQTFMAYNGGATSGSVDDIQRVGKWGPAELGALGGMDKIGMTLASAFWGYALQIWPAKTLLLGGLFVNALSTLLFGMLRLHLSMYTVKLLIGFTEGLQWVWAPLWINRWAQPNSLALWMNISGGVVAGVGSGLGIIIAGFSTANGFTYGFAFTVEATFLFILWLIMLPVDRLKMSIKRDLNKEKSIIMDSIYEEREERQEPLLADERSSFGTRSTFMEVKDKIGKKGTFRKVDAPSIGPQLEELWGSRVFKWAACSLATVNFVTSGMQFIWIRTFQGLWDLSKNKAVCSFLGAIALGSALGITFGSRVQYDPPGLGENTLPRRSRLYIAEWCRRAHVLSLAGAGIATAGLLWRVLSPPFSWSFHDSASLVMTWIGMLVVFAGLNSTPGLLQILCVQCFEDEQTRSFGTGIYQLLVNFFGLAMGPFLPQLFMSATLVVFPWMSDGFDQFADPPWALFAGFVCLLCGTIAGVMFTSITVNGARLDVDGTTYS